MTRLGVLGRLGLLLGALAPDGGGFPLAPPFAPLDVEPAPAPAPKLRQYRRDRRARARGRR